MPIIAVFSSSYSNADELSQNIANKLNYEYITDKIIESAAAAFNVSLEKLQIAIFGSSSFFSISDLERKLYLTYIKHSLLNKFSEDNKIYCGYGSLLLPSDIGHILKVCIVSKLSFRLNNIAVKKQISDKEAKNLLKNDDRIAFALAQSITNLSPYNPKLYDILIPIDQYSAEEANEKIISFANKDILIPTAESKAALSNQIFASGVQIKMLENEHNVDVIAKDGHIEIYLNKYVLFMEKYKKELLGIAAKIDGVKSAEIKIGKSFKIPAIANPVDFVVSPKVMLVDDEVEFVETLSERLKTRNYNSTIAYNGEEALAKFETDPSEVVVLDLKMPGINGLEVLEKLKAAYPETEVIILTGHGSHKEKERAMELGAFAYLEKPADIKVLSETMNEAYKKINLRKSSGKE